MFVLKNIHEGYCFLLPEFMEFLVNPFSEVDGLQSFLPHALGVESVLGTSEGLARHSMQLIFLPGAAGKADVVCNCEDDIRAVNSVHS